MGFFVTNITPISRPKQILVKYISHITILLLLSSFPAAPFYPGIGRNKGSIVHTWQYGRVRYCLSICLSSNLAGWSSFLLNVYGIYSILNILYMAYIIYLVPGQVLSSRITALIFLVQLGKVRRITLYVILVLRLTSGCKYDKLRKDI